jgi:hypothetical protein
VRWATNAAAVEAGATSIILLLSPALFGRLIFGAELSEPGQALGRLTGIVLLGFALACWPKPATKSLLAMFDREIYDDVVAVLNYLQRGLHDPADGRTLLSWPVWALWYEVNGIKGLIGSHQAWTWADAASFIGDARSYMGV